MRYCIHLVLFHPIQVLTGGALRLVSCYDLAIPLLRSRRCQGARRWLCTGKNVRANTQMFYSHLITVMHQGGRYCTWR